MADILIRGMETPKTCCECDLKTYEPEKVWNDNGIERIGVWACKRTGEIIWNTRRGENCPLVPLPAEHGRLGDLDALEDAFIRYYLNQERSNHLVFTPVEIKQHFADMIGDWPTIVPAEGGTEE